MGIILSTKNSFILGASLFFISTGVKASESILERLEKGEVVSSKIGSSFTIQTLIKKDVDEVGSQMFKDVSKFPKILDEVAFARHYITKDVKALDKKHLVYLKVRGLGDGVGILLEVKQGGVDSYSNARALDLSSESFPLRDTEAEVSLRDDAMNQAVVKAAAIQDENKKTGKYPDFDPSLGPVTNLILEGPLNDVPQLPGVRMVVNLGICSYKKPKDRTEYTYMVAKMAFGNQIVRGELGDYKGFGDTRLSLAQAMGNNFISNLRAKLEK
jgi:hypothetical protein